MNMLFRNFFYAVGFTALFFCTKPIQILSHSLIWFGWYRVPASSNLYWSSQRF
jgi:hypothetical protein